jgi:hypothetical protein
MGAEDRMQQERPARIVRRAIGRMPRWQRAAIVALVVVIVLTWLATCIVLATFLG